MFCLVVMHIANCKTHFLILRIIKIIIIIITHGYHQNGLQIVLYSCDVQFVVCLCPNRPESWMIAYAWYVIGRHF